MENNLNLKLVSSYFSVNIFEVNAKLIVQDNYEFITIFIFIESVLLIQFNIRTRWFLSEGNFYRCKATIKRLNHVCKIIYNLNYMSSYNMNNIF